MRTLALSIFLIVSFLGFSHDGKIKRKAIAKAEVNLTKTFEGVVGIIHCLDPTVKPYIEVVRKGRTMKLVPVKMSREFLKDGRQVSFDYRLAKDPVTMKILGNGLVEIENVRSL